MASRRQSPPSGGGLRSVSVFVLAALRFWLTVFPVVCIEYRRARARANRIADRSLRKVALDAQRKWGNIEGASAFATFVPLRRRHHAIRAMVCFQAAYNYLDMLAESPSLAATKDGQVLHRALLSALESHASHRSREEDQWREDSYLREMVDRCRAELGQLPSYRYVEAAARAAGERIVMFQSLTAGAEGENGLAELEQWARAQTPSGSALEWWETFAAAGSSLGVYALIAAGARPDLQAFEVVQIEDAYWPWIGALHSLLDNLVDVAEDHAIGQHNLIDCYASGSQVRERMRVLAERAEEAARGLAGANHRLILSAMASFYLSTLEALLPAVRPVADTVLDALGQLATLAMFVFRVRLAARSLAFGHRSRGAEIVLPDQDQSTREYVK